MTPDEEEDIREAELQEEKAEAREAGERMMRQEREYRAAQYRLYDQWTAKEDSRNRIVGGKTCDATWDSGMRSHVCQRVPSHAHQCECVCGAKALAAREAVKRG